ncbi:MAG: hypothetical protein M1816_000210 [Peltula sp. TS41687]|nr:MAG: hypothetical protein M1816_000210 [Peltula sp. TS41687]
MRYQYMFILTVLVAAVTTARLPKDPRSWGTYVSGESEPPFPPPDIGPYYLPRKYFRDFPEFTTTQIRSIRRKNTRLHQDNQRDIADRWHRLGERPTPETVTRRAEKIQAEIRRDSKRLQAKTSQSGLLPDVMTEDITEEIQRQNDKLDACRAEQRLAEAKVKQSEQDLADANIVIGDCEQKRGMIKALHVDLRAQQKNFKLASPEFGQFEQQIREQKDKLWQVEQRQRNAKTAAGIAKSKMRNSNTTIRDCERKKRETEARIRELTAELETLRNHITEDGTETHTEDRTEDGNLFTAKAMTDGVKKWAQGWSDSLLSMIHRVSTVGRPVGGNTGFRPLGGVLPNPAFAPVPY